MSINVQLPKFEGPLGLLLYLIRKEEMDIMDIKIHEITNQYLDYIKLMKELDLEVAGEFIAMASTLIHIKSRMLLPQYNDQGEIVDQEDPRKELVQKLLEYQKYQEAAKALYDRPLVGRDIWLRGIRESLQPQEEEIVLEENALFSLISTYRKVLRAVKRKVHQVTQKTQSISSRILEIKDYLFIGRKVTLMDLVTTVENRSRQVLITFLSLLELGKMELVSLYQTETYSDIWVEAKKDITGDVLSRVEEYDSINADEIAEKMMARAQKDNAIAAEDDEEFILTDAEDNAQLNLTSQMEADLQEDSIEIASDDEIMAAEAELEVELKNEIENSEPEAQA
jgi:segregation and condensation protein A